MDISSRLDQVVKMVPKCSAVADIGTDHGYVLIALLKRNRITRGIASDNKKKPLEKAMMNAREEGVASHLDFRLGSGLETLKPDEVNGAVIAGMGGILIQDLITSAPEVVRSLDFLLLQPAQNPEILRKFLYENHFEILDEEMIKEDRRYYEYLMVKYVPEKTASLRKLSDYSVGDILYRKGHPLMEDFLNDSIRELEKIQNKMDLSSENARNKQVEMNKKINELRRLRDGNAG